MAPPPIRRPGQKLVKSCRLSLTCKNDPPQVLLTVHREDPNKSPPAVCGSWSSISHWVTPLSSLALLKLHGGLKYDDRGHPLNPLSNALSLSLFVSPSNDS